MFFQLCHSRSGGPFTYAGRSYLRNGPTTTAMPQQLYERKLLERMHATSRWENQPATDVSLEGGKPAMLQVRYRSLLTCPAVLQ